MSFRTFINPLLNSNTAECGSVHGVHRDRASLPDAMAGGTYGIRSEQIIFMTSSLLSAALASFVASTDEGSRIGSWISMTRCVGR
jgi:hypothetical protein